MKKFLSIVCILALALVICVPAFAEDATPGQIVENIASAAQRSPTLENGKALTQAVKNDAVTDLHDYVREAMYGVMVLNSVANNIPSKSFEQEGFYITAYASPDSDPQIEVALTDKNELRLTGSFRNGTQSEVGVYIFISIPGSTFDSSKSYIWTNDQGERGTVELRGGNTLAFWAPHFSEYTIREGTLAVQPPVTPAPSDTSAAPSASIIKPTGSDMNLTAMIIAVLALVSTAGSAVILKKRVLDK